MKAIVDCNSFYCSCERVFRPELAKIPVIVLSNNDGCIISRTDEAKDLGFKMAGAYYQVRSLAKNNNVAVFSSNYNLYGDLSQRVMHTLKSFAGDENVEVYSVDESFLDLDSVPGVGLTGFCKDVKNSVEKWTGIPVSIGVASTKVLCKVANRLAKKDKDETQGILVLDTPVKIDTALQRTSVGDIWGIGQRYARKLEEQNILTAFQLSLMNEEWGRKNLGGVVGVRLIRELRGEPAIELKDPLTVKKMITTSRMFGTPVTELSQLKEAVATYVSRAAEKLRRQSCAAKDMYVFVVINDYQDEYEYKPETFGLNVRLPVATSSTNLLIDHAFPLVEQLFRNGSKFLKAGVILDGLVPDNCIQSNLFESPASSSNQVLMEALDNINFSMRDDVIKFASSGLNLEWKMQQGMRSPRYTSRWDELREVI